MFEEYTEFFQFRISKRRFCTKLFIFVCNAGRNRCEPNIFDIHCETGIVSSVSWWQRVVKKFLAKLFEIEGDLTNVLFPYEFFIFHVINYNIRIVSGKKYLGILKFFGAKIPVFTNYCLRRTQQKHVIRCHFVLSFFIYSYRTYVLRN